MRTCRCGTEFTPTTKRQRYCTNECYQRTWKIDHRTRESARKAMYSRRWREAGACTMCGLPTEQYTKCLKCRVKQARWSLAWYNRNKKKAA